MLLAFLLSMFALQTYLVYSDDTGRSLPPLSATALAGRATWLENNCQACHQFYGFGGFLGPDLTNAADRLDRARLDQVLTNGFGQMPAFHLAPDQVTAIQAYLTEMSATGVGQARAPRPEPGPYATAVRSLATGDAAAGAARFLGGACPACHAPLAPRRIGPYLAPDLSRAPLTDAEIDRVLREGRPTLGMPPTGLDAVGVAEMVAFLRWQRTNRARIRDEAGGTAKAGLPWFEFR